MYMYIYIERERHKESAHWEGPVAADQHARRALGRREAAGAGIERLLFALQGREDRQRKLHLLIEGWV